MTTVLLSMWERCAGEEKTEKEQMCPAEYMGQAGLPSGGGSRMPSRLRVALHPFDQQDGLVGEQRQHL
jgi:hypothetical protein